MLLTFQTYNANINDIQEEEEAMHFNFLRIGSEENADRLS